MQPQHVPKGAHQLHVQVVVEVPDLIAAAFQLLRIGSGHPHHIGELVHGFLALIKGSFQLVYAVQRVHDIGAGLRIVLPGVVVQVL